MTEGEGEGQTAFKNSTLKDSQPTVPFPSLRICHTVEVLYGYLRPFQVGDITSLLSLSLPFFIETISASDLINGSRRRGTLVRA